jgi:enhancing lycopene biosynthesis protein 2
MDPISRAAFAENSRIARVFINREMWWTVAPLIALIVTGGLGKSRSQDY